MPRAFYTNPVENLRSYIMVHGGLDRTERLQDVEWVEDLLAATAELASTATALAEVFITDNEYASLPETQKYLDAAKALKEVMPKSRFSD